jgi:hypothetical protein
VARKKKTKIFVSYSRHDEALVKPLAALLELADPEAVFLDVERLKPGDRWEKKLLAAVQESSVVVVCWCCSAAKSTFIAKEVSEALRDPRKTLVPVLLCQENVPSELSDRQWINLRGHVTHNCEENHPHVPGATNRQRTQADGLTPFIKWATIDLARGSLIDSLQDPKREEGLQLARKVRGYFYDIKYPPLLPPLPPSSSSSEDDIL